MKCNQRDKAKAATAGDQVLTLGQAAEFTKVSERTFWRLAKDEVVPHKRVGSQYRFLKSQLVEWLSGQRSEM